MRKEGWGTVIAAASAVAFSVTPSIQSWFLASPAWLVTAFAGWRWLAHRQEELEETKFDGKFFPEPPKPWLGYKLDNFAMSAGESPGFGYLSVQAHFINSSPDRNVSLVLYLVDESGKRYPAATEFEEAMHGYKAPWKGMTTLHMPVAVRAQSEVTGYMHFWVPLKRGPVLVKEILAVDNISKEETPLMVHENIIPAIRRGWSEENIGKLK